MSKEGVPISKEQILLELGPLKKQYYKNPDLYDKLVNFGQMLRKKYPDCQDYELFHFLVGSTMRPEEMATKFDFPGEDSIETFLRNQV